VVSKRFGVTSKRFSVASKRFGAILKRFDLASKRFGVASKRFEVASKRFCLTRTRFDMPRNLISLLKPLWSSVDSFCNAGCGGTVFIGITASSSERRSIMSIPLKDSLLVPFSQNFNDRIVASPTTFALSAPQAAAYTPLHTAFVAAYNALMAARGSGTQSKSLTSTKDATKNALLAYARQLYAFVQSNATVSDANKLLLGIALRSIPTPIPPPGVRPGVDVISVAGRTVSLNVHDSASSTKRGKPAPARAAWVYSFVGENYPSDPSLWNFEGSTTKAKFDILFPSTVAGGTQVWICAAWINAKQQAGPVSVPVTTNIQGGGTSTSSMKIAA